MTIADEVKDILTTSSISPHVVPKLEEHLLQQVQGKAPYHADSVRRLLHSYQLFPATAVQPENYARACFLALLEYPRTTDFLALSYLVPPATAAEGSTLALVQTCWTHLEACQYDTFWTVFEQVSNNSQDAELAKLAQRSVAPLQKAILQALSLSYKEAPAAVVCQALNIKSVDAVVALKLVAVVEKVDANWVTFVGTADNTKRERVYQESLDLASISKLMAKIAQ